MAKGTTSKKKKVWEEDMKNHREYMQKYKMQSGDLNKQEMRYKDFYELLGIPRDATHTEIRRTYRKLALKCHPDRKPSSEALAQWEGVPMAYAVLSNPNDRTKYDATLPIRDALVEFYRTYNPAKLDNATIQTIIDGWYGREVELFEMLNAKYEVIPHEGPTKGAQCAAVASLSREQAHKIAMDNQTSNAKDAGIEKITWTSTIGSILCCKGMLSRIFSSAYYEVDTTSPSYLRPNGGSNTPGQMPTNLKSPATPSQLSAPVSPEFDPSENLCTATTANGRGSESCHTGTGDVSPIGLRVAQSNVAADS